MYDAKQTRVDVRIKALVVGGDGFIAKRLTRHLCEQGAAVSTTSRRGDLGESQIHFNLKEGIIAPLLASGPNIALICAAVTDIRGCENDPLGSYKLNVTATVRLVRSLIEQGVFVVFLSSNTVFDGNSPWPVESSTHSPTTEYGKQKAEAEKQLLVLPGAGQQLAIVRLSKVLDSASGMAHRFLRQLRGGLPCQALSDLLLCPASLSYVAANLADIGIRRRPGVFHLSGDAELSYADFATRLAVEIGEDTGLVQAVQSTAVGVDALFKPRHPGLGMAITTEVFGIRPEPFAGVLASLLSSNT